MNISVTTEAVASLAAIVRRGADDVGAMRTTLFGHRAPDLGTGSAALDAALADLRSRWSPQMDNLHGDLYRLQAALGAVVVAYENVETGAASSFAAAEPGA